MSERGLMGRLVWALGERRRLWPPDGSSSLACLGLLGWMHLTYSDPEQAARDTTGWMWLGGLLDVEATMFEPHLDEHRNHFDARDQQAIEAYGAAVAGQVLQLDGPKRVSEWEVPGDAAWQPEDIARLMALGAKHGSVMRAVLAGLFMSFEDGRSYVVPMFGERTTSDPASPSAGQDDTTAEQGVGLVSLLKYVERRDRAIERAARAEPPRPPS